MGEMLSPIEPIGGRESQKKRSKERPYFKGRVNGTKKKH
jgi:hypothetical protein